MQRASGQVGAAPPGPKQDQMPVQHKRSTKVPPTVNHAGGAKPAARRALAPHASARAVRNTVMNSTPAMANQDTSMNQMNAIDQDSMPSDSTMATGSF